MSYQILEGLMARCRERLYLNGCIDVRDIRRPSLNNRIMPMFAIDRWVNGIDQLPKRFYHQMYSALQLATLFLTEDYMLEWLCHYTFGRRKQDKSSGSSRTYISPVSGENSVRAREEVKENIHALGEEIGFMFSPDTLHKHTAYGVTYWRKEELPFFHKFRSQDWPPTGHHRSSRSGYSPVVVMNSDFAKYFTMEDDDLLIPSFWYRMQFTFAITLVHEVMHAYGIWLGLDNGWEPFWAKDDAKAEFGFSWETHTIGRIIDPMGQSIKANQALLSFNIVTYQKSSHRQWALKKAVETTKHKWQRFIDIPNDKYDPKWDFRPQSTRGGRWVYGDSESPDANYAVAIHAIPIEWIRDQWFSKSQWENRRKIWETQGTYTPPRIDKTFSLLYQKDQDGICVHYPLDPAFDLDASILREREMQS